MDLDFRWSSAPTSAPKISLPRAWEQNIIQNPAPYLGAPELFWKSGLDPSLSNRTSIFRERNRTTNRHSCTPNLPAPCTTTSACAYLNSSHLLFLLQICTSFKADLELSKTEHRLGAKFYLKKQREKKKKGFAAIWVFAAICFQPPIFSSNCNSSTSVLFVYWHSCRNGKEWLSCLPVCLPRKYSIAFTDFQPLLSWGAIMWHTRSCSRYMSLFPRLVSEWFVFNVCVRVRKDRYHFPLPPKLTNAITWWSVT